MTTKAKRPELVVIYPTDGFGEIGYMIRGHVEPSVLADTARYEYDAELDVDEIEQAHLRVVPIRDPDVGGTESRFVRARAGRPGAFPVTFWGPHFDFSGGTP